MKKAVKIGIVVILLSAMIFAAFRIARPHEEQTAAKLERMEAVQVAQVTKGAIQESVLLTGAIDATARVTLAPKVGGRLMQLAVAEGDKVAKGQLIAELDKEAFVSQANQAKAAVEVAKAGISAAAAAKENAEGSYKREQALFTQGISAQAQFEAAESAFKGAAAQVEVASATLAQAQAALDAAELQVKEASVYAPFDSVVTVKFLDPGALVMPSQPIVELAAVDTVKVKAAVSEKYLCSLCAGKTPVSVKVDCLGGKSFAGTVSLVAPTIDPATRTGAVEICIPNADHTLKPGMYAQVSLVTQEKNDVVLMPEDALLGHEGSYYAYVACEGRVKRADVATGLRGNGAVEVAKGLEPGDEVVTSGEGNLFDGAQVAVEEGTPSDVKTADAKPSRNGTELTDATNADRHWEADK